MTDRHLRPFDAGLQPERTALSWRRTALSLGVASLAGMRILPDYLGPWSILIGAAGLVFSALIVWLSHRRYVAVHLRLTDGPGRRAPQGAALQAVTVAVMMILGLISLLVVILHGLS